MIIDVLDRGPGFAEDDERRIFEKFYRRAVKGCAAPASDSPSAARLSRRIARHRGVQPAGGGAVFRIRLPLASEA